MGDEILVVSERFGPTFQGEGPSAGRRCSFLRLGRCNLDCSWCDTPYTWDWTRYDPRDQLSKLTVDELIDWVEDQDTDLLVVSGGEPLLQARTLDLLVAQLGCDVEIETNGTRPPLESMRPAYNVSLKLSHSGVPRDKAIVPKAIAALQEADSIWKFVARDITDLAEVEVIVDQFGLWPVWIMPEGTDAATIQKRGAALADPVLERGWNLTLRMQTLLWGSERAR